MRGALIACFLIISPSLSTARMSWGEMQDPNTYDNFSYQILQWTHVFEAQPNYVALSEEALKSLEFWKIHLAAEEEMTKSSDRPSRGLASEGDYFHSGNDAYSSWQSHPGQPRVPVGPQSQNGALICQQGESCQSDEQFYGQGGDNGRAPRVVQLDPGAYAVVDLQRGMSPNEYASHLDQLRRMGQNANGDASQEYDPAFGFAMDAPMMDASTVDNRVVLDPATGNYVQRGEYIYQCHSGQGCNEVVGHISEFRIIGANDSSYAQERRNPSDYNSHPVAQSETQNTRASQKPGSSNTSGIASRPSRSSGIAQAFQSCEANYQRALDLCGSSFQSYNSQAVQSELNLRSGMMLAQYLQMARAASQSQGKSMYEICDNTQRMARSMTALNAAYTAICASAQNSCASSCSQAESYMRSTSTSDQEFTAALNLTSPGFDPARFHNTCKADMNQQITQGIFETAQTAQMMAQANSCKQQIAAAGPCATPEMWDSQACHDFCQDPKNAYQPACARFNAMNANCSNPEFARRNPMCLCLNNPNDPSCGAGDLLPDEDIAGRNPGGLTPGRGGSIISSSGAGSFGSRQDFQGGAQRSGQASSASQGSFPAGAAGGPIMPGGGNKGGAQAQNGQAALRGSAYNTNIIDGVQNFGGGRAGAGGQQRRYIAYGDMNSNNPYRRIAVETDDPDFDLKQYLPPEDFEAGKVRKCYYGKDRIGCMHGPSLFDMVSRQYRKLRHQMMP